MKRSGYPDRGELVVCEIARINPNSVYARLLEYDKTGMIHVSEVARRWVRNIREFVKPNQLVVCRTLKVDENSIFLSIKRVHRDQSDRRLQEFKRERNAEKLLEQVGKQFNKDLAQTYETVGHALQDEFGSLHKTFQIALKKPDFLAERGIDKKWAEAIVETAKRSFVEKTYEVKATLTLACRAPDGIEAIKDSLSKIGQHGLEVKYISASKYNVTGSGNNIKDVKSKVESACQEAIGSVEKLGGEGSFSLREK